MRKLNNLEAKHPIRTDALSFEEWFRLATIPEVERDYIVPDYQFPSDQVRTSYLAQIGTRPEAEIRELLRLFLLEGGSLGADSDLLRYLVSSGTLEPALEKHEFVRRLLNQKRHTWEGNTWILDLLPSHPMLAITAIDAYVTAQIQYLPDGRITGLSDAEAVIRARYLEKANPRDTLLTLSPRDFECLIGELYRRMGYRIKLTPPSRDGGLDIHARRSKRGQSEHLLIECKRYDAHVGVKIARALLGVVTMSNATKGVIVTTGEFTRSALDLEKATGQLDLVGFRDLNTLFNEHFGADWPTRIDFPISWFKRLEAQAGGNDVAPDLRAG